MKSGCIDIMIAKVTGTMIRPPENIPAKARMTAEMNQEWEMNGGGWEQPWDNDPWNGYGLNYY